MASCGCTQIICCGNTTICATYQPDADSSNEASARHARRLTWSENQRITLERISFPQNEYHYFDDLAAPSIPAFTASYMCSGCDKNHYEEDCPYYFGGIQPANIVRDTHCLRKSLEDTDNKRYDIRCRNERLASDNDKLANGWKFCICCAYLISPDKINAVTPCHSGTIEYSSSTGEDTCWSCCHSGDEISFNRMSVTKGCCWHTHTFD